MALINFRTEVSAINSTYAAKPDLATQKTDVGAQKIDGSTLTTYKIVLTGFSVQDKLEKI